MVEPEDVLEFWIGDAALSGEAAAAKNELWFAKSFETDKLIAERFLATLTELADGRAYDWAEKSPRAALAAIIVLDQFSRNIFRGSAGAFAQDKMALGLAKDSILRGEDTGLSEAERIFFYLPLEHSERLADQDLCVSFCEKLERSARPEFKTICENYTLFANKHRDVIVQFGRFPHRNEILNRSSSPSELAYLAEPGSGF